MNFGETGLEGQRARDCHEVAALAAAEGQEGYATRPWLFALSHRFAISYELKPYNPRALKLGNRQLSVYLDEIKSLPKYHDMDWKAVLETYWWR